MPQDYPYPLVDDIMNGSIGVILFQTFKLTDNNHNHQHYQQHQPQQQIHPFAKY